MGQDIKFHCSINGNFDNEEQLIRAFSYTDYSIEPHTHDFYEMNIVLQGSGVHRIGSHEFKVGTGAVFVIPPQTVHAYYDTNSLEVYHILIKSKLLMDERETSIKPAGYMQLMEIEPFLRSNSPNAMFLQLSQMQLLKLKEELEYIDDFGAYGGDEFIPLKKHTVMKIIYLLSDQLYKRLGEMNDGISGRYGQSVISALEFIHNNFNSKITVEMLCERCYMSRSTFLRAFSLMCGCTPAQYIDRYRCKRALELLEKNELSKTEIAHACGFYDLSHMSRKLQKL